MGAFNSITNPFGQYQSGMEGQVGPRDSNTIFRYNRTSFNTAGHKSYDSPPNQDQDSFYQLVNTMPVTRGSLERRWGLKQQKDITNLDGGAVDFRRMLEYSNPNGERFLIISNQFHAYMFDENFGQIAFPTNWLFSYTGGTFPRFVISRHYIYTSNGYILKKHSGDDSDSQTNWGLTVPDDSSHFIAYRNPTTAAVTGTDGVTWATPNNIKASDNQYVTATLPPASGGTSSFTKNLDSTNFGFTVDPDAIVTGIVVKVEAKVSAGADAGLTVELLRGGGPVGQLKQYTVNQTSDTATVLGSAADLWNTTWNASDFNGTGFGVRLIAGNNDSDQPTISLDNVQIGIYFLGAITVGAPGSGNITLSSGRKYTIAGKNSKTGHISDIAKFSVSTGPLTSKNVPLSALPVWTDSQVDQKVILATADGNDTSKLYELATIANSTTTYTDNIPESTLLLRNVYQEVDEQGIEHGVAENSPPPSGTIMCKHRSRFYMLIGSTLYYSKNDDELTTSTGLVTGRYEEAWPGDFQLDITQEAEMGTALFSDGTTLYAATERHIHRLTGDGPQNFSEPEIHFNEVGVFSQEVLQVVYFEGRPVGAMWLTPDFKVIGSDFNTYENVGRDVQDLLNRINRTFANRAFATYFGSGVYSFFALAVPLDNNAIPRHILIYDLNKRRWHVWDLTRYSPSNFLGTGCMLFNVKNDGSPRLLTHIYPYTPPTVYAYWMEFSPDKVQDEIFAPIGTLNIPVTIQTPWIHFGDHLTRKDLNEIEVMSPDSEIVLSIEGASNSTEFANPTSIVNNMQSTISRFGETKFYVASLPTRDRFYRFKWTTSAVTRTAMDAWSAEIIGEHRF